MDIEKQTNRNKGDFSFQGLQEHLTEKAKHPSVSSTLIIFLILNIIMLIVGCIHIGDCPLGKMIPIYLIVAGAVGIISKILPFINRKFNSNIITFFVYFLYIFEFIWMICGSYWVYRIPKLNFDKSTPLYCDKSAYYLAFWLLTVNWIFLGITIVLGSCAAICIAAINRRNK